MSYDKGSVTFYRKQLWFMAFILCFFFFEACPCMGLEVIYVDIDTSSGGNGTDWKNAPALTLNWQEHQTAKYG